ncbi:hypothetical protein SISSUDRAFT_1039627 [Sistotremastrum suecicum HHB10207 ss-3]|uniref:Uncharacterized protein n=1 Tax=Sistotremastrum suecicum HHB10207 ss-3 TaxID=1314776 RepID=A0A166IHJ0_9AGAM|nr:hypothetical protein SISSUDRAFT_1039627 [Sistotremastrum suecicum HHB10207 ss-3]
MMKTNHAALKPYSYASSTFYSTSTLLECRSSSGHESSQASFSIPGPVSTDAMPVDAQYPEKRRRPIIALPALSYSPVLSEPLRSPIVSRINSFARPDPTVDLKNTEKYSLHNQTPQVLTIASSPSYTPSVNYYFLPRPQLSSFAKRFHSLRGSLKKGLRRGKISSTVDFSVMEDSPSPRVIPCVQEIGELDKEGISIDEYERRGSWIKDWERVHGETFECSDLDCRIHVHEGNA